MLSALSQRARVILLGGLGAVAAFFVFGGGRGSGPPGDPLDAVPRDSFLIATMNLAELRRSPLYDVLLGKEGKEGKDAPASRSVLDAKALGIGKLTEACGFDPLSRVETLALAVPEEGDKGEIGLAARVTVTRSELSQCTTALADRRGGKVETKEVGSFAVVEDSTTEGAAHPRLAYGHGGLLVAGRGAWFDAMLAAADGKRPGVREAAAHDAMRTSLKSKDGWNAPTLIFSALLPRSLRDRLRNEMGLELKADSTGGSSQDAPPDTTRGDRGGSEPQDIMAGVLGVSAVGLAVKVGESGQNADAAAELVCDTEDGCAAVEKLLLKKRFEWSKELSLRMVGLGPLLDSIEVKRDRSRIRVTAGTSAEKLAQTIDRVLRLRGRPQARGSSDDAASAAKSREVPRRSDETIPAPRPSSSTR